MPVRVGHLGGFAYGPGEQPAIATVKPLTTMFRILHFVWGSSASPLRSRAWIRPANPARDTPSPLPVIQQIRRQVTRMVVSGQLDIGAQLPPIRQLAADLGLSRGTVAKAYDLLERDGVVETRGRHGTLIRSAGRPVAEADPLERAADQLAVVGHQLGVDLTNVTAALATAWDRLT